jgi:hypothetical protein
MFADLIGREFALCSAMLMNGFFEPIQRRLARDCGECPFDLLGIQGQLVFERGLLGHFLENQHLAESRGQLCQRQGSVEVEQRL